MKSYWPAGKTKRRVQGGRQKTEGRRQKKESRSGVRAEQHVCWQECDTTLMMTYDPERVSPTNDGLRTLTRTLPPIPSHPAVRPPARTAESGYRTLQAHRHHPALDLRSTPPQVACSNRAIELSSSTCGLLFRRPASTHESSSCITVAIASGRTTKRERPQRFPHAPFLLRLPPSCSYSSLLNP